MAPTEIYTLSLHDALPISDEGVAWEPGFSFKPPAYLAPLKPRRPELVAAVGGREHPIDRIVGDRKSTRLNSSHVRISYAVFCLKKKKHTRNLSICICIMLV